MEKYDVIVAGGGMVGALTAVLLAKQLGMVNENQERSHSQPAYLPNISIAVIEEHDVNQITFGTNPQLRNSAFSYASIQLLKTLGIWQGINPARHAPYLAVETWQQPKNKLTFRAADIGYEYLGHILENHLVQQGIWQVFEQCNIELICPDKVVELHQESAQSVRLLTEKGRSLKTHLLIAADGSQSKVRRLANIGTDGWQYRQQCLAINVQMHSHQSAVTWQEFHPSGPRAYLPLYDNFASLIWYDSVERIQQLSALTPPQLKQAIQAAFPSRLADFTIIQSASFPLTRLHAKHYYQDNLVLVGDAAHSINPLAGQGVNLGFKDAKQLVDCICDGLSSGKVFYHSDNLKRYHKQRYRDNLLMMTAMDAIYLGFSNDIRVFSLLRNVALSVADRAGPLKLGVLKYAMGL